MDIEYPCDLTSIYTRTWTDQDKVPKKIPFGLVCYSNNREDSQSQSFDVRKSLWEIKRIEKYWNTPIAE